MFRLILFAVAVMLCVLLTCQTPKHNEDDGEVTLDEVFGIKRNKFRRAGPQPRPKKRREKGREAITIAALTEEELENNLNNVAPLFENVDNQSRVNEYIKYRLGVDLKTLMAPNATRRFWPPYKPNAEGVFSVVKAAALERLDWWRAIDHNSVVKAADNALQIIYMTRYKLLEMEKNKLYSTNSPTLKLAYIISRVRNMGQLVRKLYSKLVNSYYYYNWMKKEPYIWDLWQTGGEFHDMSAWADYHLAMVKLHTEFTYYWWVLVRLHEHICNGTHFYMTKPTSSTTTTTTTTTTESVYPENG